MRYLIDTNVLSETVRPVPEPAVLRWLEGVAPEDLFLSVLTLGEIRRGIDRLGTGTRRSRLEGWLTRELAGWFGDRVLAVDRRVADRWGRLRAELPRALPAIDGLLAATGLAHDLVVVTRNVRDFEVPGLRALDPWQSA